MRRCTLVLAAAVAGLGLLAGGTAQAAPAAPGAPAALKVNWNWPTGFLGNLPNANTPPPAANDWGCDWRSSPDRRPLILVHGTWEHQASNFQALSPFFANNGFCVYTFNFGGNPGDAFWGYKSIASNAVELSAFVDVVKARTGATQVDLLGHSQGAMMPRYYIKYLGGMGTVHKFVGLAPSNNGTTASGIATLTGALGLNVPLSSIQPAAIDQTIGSPFLQVLNRCATGSFNVCAGDTTTYTVLQTNGDQFDTPYTNSFMTHEPGAKLPTNILVNDRCPLELSEHLGMTYSRNVAQLALAALNPAGAGRVCVLSLPYLGG